jgi:hypothetical protein
VRYADDIVAGFEHKADAERFRADLNERMARFALSLHQEKTRLIEFGCRAAANRERRGLGKPETFNFLARAKEGALASLNSTRTALVKRRPGARGGVRDDLNVDAVGPQRDRRLRLQRCGRTTQRFLPPRADPRRRSAPRTRRRRHHRERL